MFAAMGMLAEASGGGSPNSIISTQTFTASSIPSSFNYPKSYAAGTKLVFAFGSRTNGGANSFSMSSSPANTFSRVIEGTQSNGFTVSAIFTVTLGAAVTASDTFTISTTGSTNYDIGGVVYELSSINVDNSGFIQPTSTKDCSQTITGTSSNAIVIHAIGTGLNGSSSVSSSTLTVNLSNAPSGSKQFILSGSSTGASFTDTVTMSLSGNYSSVMAAFS